MRPRLHADHEVAVELAVDLANEGRAAGRRRRGIADLDAKLRANEDADVGVLLRLLEPESPDGDIADHGVPPLRTHFTQGQASWLVMSTSARAKKYFSGSRVFTSAITSDVRLSGTRGEAEACPGSSR
jgi:hypothetical protein